MDLKTVSTDYEPVYLPWLKGECKDLSPIPSLIFSALPSEGKYLLQAGQGNWFPS